MKDQMLNEAEKYLLDRWKDARSMEEQMAKVREKYTNVCQRVIDAMKEKQPELDLGRVWATQFWGNGSIGVGSGKWPFKSDGEFTGFWLDYIRLEILAGDGLRPTGSVWITGKLAADEMDSVKSKIQKSSSLILSNDEKGRWKKGDSRDSATALWYELPEANKDLLKMLMEDDGQIFVTCMVGHLESLARFTHVLNDVFAEARTNPTLADSSSSG